VSLPPYPLRSSSFKCACARYFHFARLLRPFLRFPFPPTNFPPPSFLYGNSSVILHLIKGPRASPPSLFLFRPQAFLSQRPRARPFNSTVKGQASHSMRFLPASAVIAVALLGRERLFVSHPFSALAHADQFVCCGGAGRLHHLLYGSPRSLIHAMASDLCCNVSLWVGSLLSHFPVFASRIPAKSLCIALRRSFPSSTRLPGAPGPPAKAHTLRFHAHTPPLITAILIIQLCMIRSSSSRYRQEHPAGERSALQTLSFRQGVRPSVLESFRFSGR